MINTSRGSVVDEKALINALQTGHVKRAGLDVFEREPYFEKELLENDNVVISPHYAAFTHEGSMSPSLTQLIYSDSFRSRSA